MSWDTNRTERIDLEADVFGRMRNLRFLEISGPGFSKKGIDILPEELIILQWKDYPLPVVPLNFCAENLVILKMPWSELVQLWDGDLQFPNLKKIDLRGSRNLCELPNLCQTPNIEEIDVSDCTSLLQFYSSGPLHKLSKLLLDRCRSLKSVWVSKLEQLWDGSPSFPYLSEMSLYRCENLVSLVHLSETPNIRKINLVLCEKLRDVNVGGNMIDEGTSSSVLEVVFNFFDLRRLLFIKVSVKVFMCDDGGESLLSGFGLKVEYSESEEIKSLAQSLSSLLPSVFVLRWIDITKSSDHYDSHFQTRFPHPEYLLSPGDIVEVVLERRESNFEYYYEKEVVRGHRDGVFYTVYKRYKIVRFPEGINRWSSLDSEALKSLGECDCRWFQPIKDLTFSVNTATGGTRSDINYYSEKLCQLHSTTIRCYLSFTARMLQLKVIGHL